MLIQGLWWKGAFASFMSLLWKTFLSKVSGTECLNTCTHSLLYGKGNKSFTLVYRHRHQSDHECEKLDTPKPRMAATQQLVKHIIGKYSRIYSLQFFFWRLFELVAAPEDSGLTKWEGRMWVPCLNRPKLTSACNTVHLDRDRQQ